MRRKRKGKPNPRETTGLGRRRRRPEPKSQGESAKRKERRAVVETRSVSVTHRDASDAVLPQPVATIRPVPLNTAEYHPQFSQSIMLVSSLLLI